MSFSASTTQEKKPLGHDPRPTELEIEKTQKLTSIVTSDGLDVNASGHRDQLQRQYGLLSICGLALTIDNAWVALGGSLTVSIRKITLLEIRTIPEWDDGLAPRCHSA